MVKETLAWRSLGSVSPSIPPNTIYIFVSVGIRRTFQDFIRQGCHRNCAFILWPEKPTLPGHSSEFTCLCLEHALHQLFLAVTPVRVPRIPYINDIPASICYRSRMFIFGISLLFYSGGQVASSSDILSLDPFTYKIFLFSIESSCSVLWVLAFFSCFQIHFHCFLFTPHPSLLCCLLFLSSCIEAFVSSHRLLWKALFIFSVDSQPLSAHT